MSLSHILLTLAKDPVSGYELNRTIEETISHFWAADQAQVYRHLKKLEQDHLLKSWEAESVKGPPRKMYQRTSAGRKKLIGWLKSDPALSPERAGYVAQLVFLWEVDDLSVTLEFIKNLKARFQESYDVFSGIENEESQVSLSQMPIPELHGFLGLRLAVDTAAARIAWCDWAITTLRKRIRADQKL